VTYFRGDLERWADEHGEQIGKCSRCGARVLVDDGCPCFDGQEQDDDEALDFDKGAK